VFVALGLVVLLGFLGLGIDMGYMRYMKRQAQMAADAAAVAGAAEISTCAGTAGCSGLTTAAKTAVSTDNLFPRVTQSTGCSATPAAGATVVLVNNPPTCLTLGTAAGDDPHKGDNNYVEVYVYRNVPTFFARVFGPTSATVSARAEAKLGSAGGCLYALGSSGGISVVGSGGISAPSCGILDNYNLSSTGSANITASSIGVVGTVSNVGSGTISPAPVSITPVSDPLAYLSPPTPQSGSCTNTINISGSGSYTYNPGNYCSISTAGSLSVTFTPGNYLVTGNVSFVGSGPVTFGAGNYTINGTFSNTGSGNVSLGAGLYYLNGLSLTGSGTVSGTSVTLYNNSGAVNVTGSQTVQLVAPTTGTYAGILFYQNRSDASAANITGSETSILQGALYFPDAGLTITGSSSTAAYTILVASSVSTTGSDVVDLPADYSSLPGGSPVKSTDAAVLGE
jgi:Flp pilus assembly protein TadG